MEQPKKDGEEKKEGDKEDQSTVEKTLLLLYRPSWSRYRNFRGLQRPAGGYGETNKPT